MGVEEVHSTQQDSATKRSRLYFAIAYAFLFAMALFWSVDASIVYIFLGIACFFLFLGFFSRPSQPVSQSYRQTQRKPERDYPGSTESIEEQLKNIFQRRSPGTTPQASDALAKGKKIAIAVGIVFFVLFAIPFIAVLFGSDSSADSFSNYNAAQQHFFAQEYDSASIKYRRAIQQDPEYAEAILGYGEVLVARNERDSAIMMFDRALEINPDYKEATYKKAAAWYDQKKYNEAIDILTPMFEAQPEYYDAMLLMGDCYYIQNKFDDAIGWYEKAYQNGVAKSSNLCYVMAYIYDTKRDYDKAVPLYKEALTYDDTIADIYKRLGELFPGEEGNAYRARAMELGK
jgi:tetratricopeptide (TPR) repeat protein